MNAQLTALPRRGRADEAAGATVAWPAVLAGVVVAVAIGVVLLALGSGVELGAAARPGPPAGAVLPPGVWLCLMQFLAAAGGGYLAGRLRRRSPETSAEEIAFRDTAHGLLVWAVVVVFSAALALSVNASLLGAAARGPVSTSVPFTEGGRYGGEVTVGGTPASASLDRAQLPAGAADRAEMARAVVDAYEGLSVAERAQLRGQLAARLRISEAESGQQIAAAIGRARWAATGVGHRVLEADLAARQPIDLDGSAPQEMARGAASRFSWWLFVSLLLGGLGASAAAILGGRRRDHAGRMA